MVFSFLTWTAPLWGQVSYLLLAGGIGLSLFRAYYLFGISYALLMRTGLPTAAASLAWRETADGVRFLSWPVLYLPLASTALFLSQVATWADASYALYWVAVPIGVMLLPARLRTSLFVRALISSMTAHMIGSLIVLLVGMPVVWAALVPKVFFERLVAATAMTAVAYTYQALRIALLRTRAA